MLHLALSNTINPVVDEEGEVHLQGSSPDEDALCRFAASVGYELRARNPTRLRIGEFRDLDVDAFESSDIPDAVVDANTKASLVQVRMSWTSSS
jgi:magnesium-transporting ATPase (P-type)